LDVYQIAPDEPLETDKAAVANLVALTGLPPRAGLDEHPSPNPAGKQEVIFSFEEPGALPVKLTLDTLADDLSEQVAEIAETAFILRGEPGLAALMDSFRGREDEHPWSSSHRPDPLEADRRRRLIKALDAYWRALADRVRETERLIAALATGLARKRLSENRGTLLSEAGRYLSLSGPDAAEGVLALNTTHTLLTGPDIDGLVSDLQTIDAARAVLSAAERQLADLQEAAADAVIQNFREEYRAHAVRMSEADVVQALSSAAQRTDVQDAQKDVDRQRARLAALITRLASNRPILFRLANTEIPDAVSRHVTAVHGRSPAIPRAKAIQDLGSLRTAVAGALGSAYAATRALEDKLDDPELTWRFERLILATLRSVDCGPGTFAGRVAQDRLNTMKEEGALSRISSSLGAIALCAAVTGAEPVAAGLTIAQLVIDALDLGVRAFETRDKQLGADAFLNPASALDVEPSWASVGISAFFVLIGIATAGSGVKH
jgi:hypothetical protein